MVIATFTVVLGVYIKTAYPTIPGGDSGELVAMVCAGEDIDPWWWLVVVVVSM